MVKIQQNSLFPGVNQPWISHLIVCIIVISVSLYLLASACLSASQSVSLYSLALCHTWRPLSSPGSSHFWQIWRGGDCHLKTGQVSLNDTYKPKST